MAKRAYIFPGQGAQAVGMGRDLLEASPAAAEVYRRADDIVGFELSRICFEGPVERLEQTDVQQPAILVTSLALWAALQERGAVGSFDCAAGLSLGEYTALHICGALSFEDAVGLVQQRGRFMQDAAEAADSGMVSILGLDEAAVAAVCSEAAQGGVLQPANFNCPGQVVVSGDVQACQRVVSIVEAGRGKAVKLKVAGAFHSPFMEPAAERLRPALSNTAFQEPHPAVLSNVDAAAHGGPEDIRERLYRQVCSPVRWQGCIERMIADGIEEFVEVGPGRTLSGMMRKIDRKRTTINVSTAAGVEQQVSHSPS